MYRPQPARFRTWLAWLLPWLLAVPAGAAPPERRRAFDLPAGEAAETLKLFAGQAQREILFPVEGVAGVRTHAVKGRFLPRAALDRMLARTGLVVVEDPRTGALMVNRAARPPSSPPTSVPPKQASDPPFDPMKRNPIAAALSGLVALAATPFTPAQNIADTPPPAERPVELSPFRVDATKESGYLASTATSGTRLNMPIRDLPMQLEVLTRDFIEDIGAYDFKEALQYSAGVVQDEVQASNNFLFSPSGTGQSGANTLRADGTALNIRGFNTRFVLRNGFRLDTVTDVINTGRQEVARGPQALLYGVSALGGIVNVLPRYPTAQPRTTIRLGYGSEDFRRAEMHYNAPAINADGRVSVNHAYGLVYQDSSDYTDFNDRERLLFTPSFDLRFGRNTSLFVDFEVGKFEATGIGFKDVNDNGPAFRNEFGLNATNRNIYNEELTVGRYAFGRSNEYRMSGGDTYEKTDYFNAIAELTHRMFDGRLTLLVGGNYNMTDLEQRLIDSQSVVFSSGTTAPTTAFPWTDAGVNPANPAQRLFKYTQYQWAMPTRDKQILQFRAEANYQFELFGQPQNLLLGRQETSLEQKQLSTAQVVNGAGASNSRTFRAWNDLSPIAYLGEQVRPFRDNEFQEWNQGHYLVYQGRFWDERIIAIGGYRWDRYMVRDLNYTYAKADTTQPDSNIGNWQRPTGPDGGGNSAPGAVPAVNGYRFGGNTQYEENPMGGVSVRLRENLNLYAMSGRGVFPNTGQRDGAGNPFGAEGTQGTDLGLKWDLVKGPGGRTLVSVQLGAYEIERENAVYNLFWAPQPRSNDRNRDRGGGVPVGGRMATGTGAGAYAVYSSGYRDFQSDRPVTYLLPVSYVAAGDLAHPRVTGAPQLNGFLLVDYASLGASATDPLRRAMDAAASDAGNLTALQTAGQGSGATGLFANNAYALNRNSDVAYNDRSRGIDLSVVLNPVPNYSATLSYSYIQQEVTGGFRVVDQVGGTEYDSWWNFMGVPLEDRRGNADESSFDFSGTTVGVRTIDAPEHQFATWNRYTFTEGRLKGFDVGLGLTWRAARQSTVLLDNGARGTGSRPNTRLKPDYPDDTKLNLALGYRTRFANRDWRLQLNVYNLLDDRKDQAFGNSTLFINPANGNTVDPATFAGAQQITVPERATIYFAPLSFRLSASTTF